MALANVERTVAIFEPPGYGPVTVTDAEGRLLHVLDHAALAKRGRVVPEEREDDTLPVPAKPSRAWAWRVSPPVARRAEPQPTVTASASRSRIGRVDKARMRARVEVTPC